MKRKIIIQYFICVILLGLGFQKLNAQSFEPKKQFSYFFIDNNNDVTKTLELNKVFHFPRNLNLKDDLSMYVSAESDNKNLVTFENASYSKNKGTILNFKLKKGVAGRAKITLKINYKGEEYINNKIQFHVNYILAKNETESAVIGKVGVKTLSSLIKKKSTSYTLDDVKILNTPKYGLVEIKKHPNKYGYLENSIVYTPNPETPLFKRDTIKYKVIDNKGNSDNGELIFISVKNMYASKAIDFLPAPGQFVNEGIAQSNSAESILGKKDGMISLGGYGGYVILGFDQPIVNRPENPYGVDFQIKGNSFIAGLYGVWTEPGAVQVMKDKNGNGLPDDGEWYELAGSDYYFSTTQKNVTMTYYNPKYDERYTIPWSTNTGRNGAMRTNLFHKHPYYPNPFDFNCNPDSLSYQGNLIQGCIDLSSPSYIENYRAQLFGYADNRGYNKKDMTIALNPYYNDANGNAIDGFDLEWAVDKNGNYVDLDTVHFIKVYTALNQDGGWLGELSTEVLGAALTIPDPEYVPKDYYVHYMSIPQLKVLKGTQLQYEGILFKNGRPSNEGTPEWSVTNPEVGHIDQNGLFTATENGETFIKFKQKDGIGVDSVRLRVVELRKVLILMEGNASQVSNDTTELLVDEKIYLTAECEDNISETLNSTKANRYTYEKYKWSTTNPQIGTIENGLFHGLKAGKTTVFVSPENRPDLKDSIVVIVNDIPKLKLRHNEIIIPEDMNEGSLSTDSLFIKEDKGTIFLKSVAAGKDFITTTLENNSLLFTYNSSTSLPQETILLIQAEYHHKKNYYFMNLVRDTSTGDKINLTDQSLTLAPNPTNNFFTLNVSGEVSIYSASGAKVYENPNYISGSHIQVTDLANGIYFVKINNKTIKLIKQ